MVRDSYLWLFLTVRAGVDYTCKFETCRSRGLTAALCLQEELAIPGKVSGQHVWGRATKGGVLCQSAHFNRGSDAAQRRTDSARA